MYVTASWQRSVTPVFTGMHIHSTASHHVARLALTKPSARRVNVPSGGMELSRHVRAVFIANRAHTILAAYLHYDREMNGLTFDSFKETTRVRTNCRAVLVARLDRL